MLAKVQLLFYNFCLIIIFLNPICQNMIFAKLQTRFIFYNFVENEYFY